MLQDLPTDRQHWYEDMTYPVYGLRQNTRRSIRSHWVFQAHKDFTRRREVTQPFTKHNSTRRVREMLHINAGQTKAIRRVDCTLPWALLCGFHYPASIAGKMSSTVEMRMGASLSSAGTYADGGKSPILFRFQAFLGSQRNTTSCALVCTGPWTLFHVAVHVLVRSR